MNEGRIRLPHPVPEMKLIDGKPHHVADLVINMTGAVQQNGVSILGTWEDWPAHVTEPILQAIEELRKKTGKPYRFYHAQSDHTPEDGWYIHARAVAPIFISG